jgi:hypothetical protein
MEKNVWTKEETEVLKAHWSGYNQRELHEKFLPNKTPIQINNKKMGLGLKKPPVWTNEERAILLDNGSKYTHRELAARFFPNKTPLQVNYMRRHLGIRRGCTDIKLN